MIPTPEGIPAALAEELAGVALAAATAAGARFAEVRVVKRDREALDLRDGALDRRRVDRDLGVAVRALVADGWGHAGTNLLSRDGVARAAAQAVMAARATAATARYPVALPPALDVTYTTPLARDPFGVALADKVAPFAAAHDVMLSVAGVTGARGTALFQAQETWLFTTGGGRGHQRVVLSGGGITAIAKRGDEVQTRSAPKAVEGNVLQGGFELVDAMNLPGEAQRVADEAVLLTRAAPLPAGDKTVILAGSQLSLQIHESVGHPTELDRALGEEISLAGASFLLPEQLDQLRFGSDRVNLTADATTPTGPGTFGFDDEGTPATRTPLVEQGRFVGYLSGRDAAARLGRPSAGALRAESWEHLPIVRMINVNLEPGEGSLADLVAGVDDGVLLDVNKSWSIDDLRLNFQFGCELAYAIRGGRLTGDIYKNPVYTGVTPRFWGDCSGVAGPEAWRVWGWSYCGKGDPVQLMYVGHGCAPARFERVSVRST